VRQELAKRGHQVVAEGGGIEVPTMLHIDPESLISAAGDAVVGRHAAGLSD